MPGIPHRRGMGTATAGEREAVEDRRSGSKEETFSPYDFEDNRERRRKAEELAHANIFVRALHHLNVKFYQYNCTLAMVMFDPWERYILNTLTILLLMYFFYSIQRFFGRVTTNFGWPSSINGAE